MMSDLKPAVFLDRDGTINVDKGYVYKIEDFEYLDGAIEGLIFFQKKGYLLVVITNQSGIARGLYSEMDFINLNEWMMKDLEQQGVHISRTYYCPHHPSAIIEKYRLKCYCRKPKTALFWRAQKELGIDMVRSIAIGDKERDLCICTETAVKGYLLGERSLLDIAKEVSDYSNAN